MINQSLVPDIRHVVVLMLENRSFDCMLGVLWPQGPEFDGLTGLEHNLWTTRPGPEQRIDVWTDPEGSTQSIRVPDPDPGETFDDISRQILGRPADGLAAQPTMDGFVDNYMLQIGTAPRDPSAPMHYFTPERLPVLRDLARAFGVSDRWHASAPCQTWPNRLFVHTATAGGFVNNSPGEVPFAMPTVYDRLAEKGKTWAIYFHDIPQTATLLSLWSSPGGFHHFRRFTAAAASGSLPNYSFIEPRYFADVFGNVMPNDGHPPHDVIHGERLVAEVYDALRSGPAWKNTLLIITYDEHGGCYDHVGPPPAVSPGGHLPNGFAFDRFGVRVPAVVVSPYMAAGTVIRPEGNVPFDHTSIFATMQELFGLAPLTPRSDAAPDLLFAFTADPDNDGPTPFGLEPVQPSAIVVGEASARPMNGMQRSLADAAVRLPSAGVDPAVHVQNLAVSPPAAPVHLTVGDAAVGVALHMARFRGTSPT